MSQERLPQDELILRDHLALDRTRLANERTFLAYLRTALTLLIAGVSFIRFFGALVIEAVGWLFLPIGLAVLTAGIARYRQMNRRIAQLEQFYRDEQ